VAQGIDQEYQRVLNRFTFIECPFDHHWFLKSWPKLDDFPKIYENYQTKNSQGAYSPHPWVRKIKEQFFDKHRLSPFLEFKSLEAQLRFLEVGSGKAHGARVLRQLFPHAQIYALDIEFSLHTKDELKKLNINIIECSWENFDTDLIFDGIMAVHFIEHIHHPQDFLKWAKKHLCKNGLLYLETPNRNCLCYRIFGKNWGMFHYPRHLHLFTDIGLRNLVQKQNLQPFSFGHHSSAAAWIMSMRNVLGKNALTKGPWYKDFFHYSHPLTLILATAIDLFLLTLKQPTSAQYIWCKKTE